MQEEVDQYAELAETEQELSSKLLTVQQDKRKLKVAIQGKEKRRQGLALVTRTFEEEQKVAKYVVYKDEKDKLYGGEQTVDFILEDLGLGTPQQRAET